MVYDGTQDVKIGSVINGTPNFTEGALLTTGGTMSGAIDMGNSKITNIDTPTEAGDALAWGKPARVTALLATGTVSVTGGTAAAPSITPSNDTNTGILFPTADSVAFSAGGVEAMRVASNANVGIGSISPRVKLDVNAGEVMISNGVGSAASTGGTLWLNTGGNSTIRAAAIKAITTTTDNGHSLLFYTNAGSANPVERMRIGSTGHLTVAGVTPIDGNVTIYANQGNSGCLSTTNNGLGTYFPAYFYNNGALVGYIQSSSTATNYVTSSDYRLKENIAPMTGALAKVAALKPVTYKWKIDGSQGQGFIAHELQAVVPECVTGTKDAVERIGNILDAENNIIQENVREPVGEGKIDGQVWQFVKERPVYQGIDTSFLVGTLTAAIQELKAIVDAQAKRIEALEAK
jgi:hypothetical protein